jgi:hypothetical protein
MLSQVSKVLLEELKDGSKNLLTGATTKFKDIIKAAKSLPGEIGKGIKDNIVHAVGAIVNLADELIKKFKKALGIKSPSKVFTEMGGHIISGLTNGLTSGNLLDLGKTCFQRLWRRDF